MADLSMSRIIPQSFLQKKKNVLVSPPGYNRAEQKTGEMVMDDGVPMI